MKKVKGFSYDTEKDKDVIEYIQKQPHQANYIWNLVRKDMQSNNDQIEDMVRKYVEKILKEKNIEIKDKKKTNISKNEVMEFLSTVTNN